MHSRCNEGCQTELLGGWRGIDVLLLHQKLTSPGQSWPGACFQFEGSLYGEHFWWLGEARYGQSSRARVCAILYKHSIRQGLVAYRSLNMFKLLLAQIAAVDSPMEMERAILSWVGSEAMAVIGLKRRMMFKRPINEPVTTATILYTPYEPPRPLHECLCSFAEQILVKHHALMQDCCPVMSVRVFTAYKHQPLCFWG